MLSNSQYNEIERIYDARRKASRDLKDARSKELRDKYPFIAEIEEKIVSESVKAGRLAIAGDLTALKELERNNGQLIDSKREFLARNGYPEDYLDDVYECPKCKDSGKIDGRPCECFYRTVINHFYMPEDRRELLKKESFQTFDVELYSKEKDEQDPDAKSDYEVMSDSVNAALDFVEGFEHNYQNLLITGESGTGKTFLANCIAGALLEKNIGVLYMLAYELFQLFSKATFSRGEEGRGAEEEKEIVYSADCLIIDDLGTELTNAFVTSELFACIERRHLAGKATIITTNLSPAVINNRYSERIASRLIGNYKFLVMPGKDNRITE
ncbi:MAG: ATP-binding protein [Lachnospiraceae bacterium]|nr:ATP-binding protein [Lachnospiraceae bacterium]